MPGDTCIICGNTRAKDASVSMHRFPQEQMKRERWLRYVTRTTVLEFWLTKLFLMFPNRSRDSYSATQ